MNELHVYEKCRARVCLKNVFKLDKLNVVIIGIWYPRPVNTLHCGVTEEDQVNWRFVHAKFEPCSEHSPPVHHALLFATVGCSRFLLAVGSPKHLKERHFAPTYSIQFRNQCVECVWNVMAHAQKPDFVFRRNGQVHLNQQGRQFYRLLAAEVCTSAVVMLDTPSSRGSVKGTGYPLNWPVSPLLPPGASPCAITIQLDFTRV